MAAALAADSTTPGPAPDGDGSTSMFATIWNALADTLPGGNLTVLGGLVVLGMLANQKAKKRGGMSAAAGKEADKAVGAVVKGTFRSLWSVVALLLKFVAGRELHGPARTDARFFKSGTRSLMPAPVQPVAQLGSVALAPPRVSLVKPRRRQASPWARNASSWIQGYRGRAASVLDWSLRVVLLAVRIARTGYRWGQAVARVCRAVYGVVAPVVTTLARALGRWHYWPYAARGLARLALLGALFGLSVPAWRTWTIGGLVLALTAAVVAARYYKATGPGDDAVYGPRIWAVLCGDLGLPEGEPREGWLHLPQSLAAPNARIVVRLPWTWRGSEMDRQNLSNLINSRVPGEWVARVTLTGETFTAVYTHKPPPKPPAPEPTCPDMVDFFADDIQEAIAACKTGEIVLGKDRDDNVIVRRLDGETPHWALSVGSGGGKSTFNVSVAVQLIAQGYHIIVADVKRSSVKPLQGIPGVHIYNDPSNPNDMRRAIEWFKDEIDARSYVKNRKPEIEFPGLLLLIEESNEFADVSKEWWDDNRKPTSDKEGPADKASDPIWGEVASAARLGRFVRGNILAVFQDMRDQALGGKGLRNLFPLKFMGNFTVNSWKNVIGTTPVPESVNKAGRMMLVEGNSPLWVQTLYGKGDRLAEWALIHRKLSGFDPKEGLFGEPPARSSEREPHLLRTASRDELPEALRSPSEGGLSEETAGRLSRQGGDVTLSEGDVTASRDRLRLIPGQGGHQAQEGAVDPTAPPELLPLAEVARRLEGEEGVPVYDTMRAHKSRREEFPKGTENNGRELYTVDQIRAYYALQKKKA